MNTLELKIARIRRGMKGRQVAEALGLTIGGYQHKETGRAGVSLAEAFTLTKLFQLTLTEFVNIFFDGELPFLQEKTESCRYGESYLPLKEARLRSGVSEQEAANVLGIPVGAYKQRENGKVQISLEAAAKLSKLYQMSLDDFNDVFFRSRLPFRNSDLIDFTYIIPQKAGGINAEKSY